jgi:Rieske Fe-S protein
MLSEQVTAQIAAHNQTLVNTVQTLREEVHGMSSRPHTIINHTHNHTTINQYILDTKEPLSLKAIEASVAMGMKANVLRDGAQGIAQYVIRENELPKKVHISDKSRAVARYHEIDGGDKVANDKGCTMILDHIFVKFGRDGEIVVDRLYDELEKHMTEQNEIGAWPDDFYDEEMTHLGRLRLEWKKASEGHNNKLRKDVAKAIVLRCQ